MRRRGEPRVVAILPALRAIALAGLGLSASPAGAGEEPAAARPSTSQAPAARETRAWDAIPLPRAAQKGIKWLVVAQEADGSWGPNGRAASPPAGHAKGSDVGNTAVAALALLATGSTPRRGTFQGPLQRAVDSVLRHVERSGDRDLALAMRGGQHTQTQLQRKIGRYADTFLAARFLAEVDGHMPTDRANRRVHRAVAKLVRKIERGQSSDGSWNQTGGWAPIHSTAFASQALWRAGERGHDVSANVLEKATRYTLRTLRTSTSVPTSPAPSRLRDSPRRKRPVTTPSGGAAPAPAAGVSAAAGVVLYALGQSIEQLTRTAEDRKRYASEIEGIVKQVGSERVLKGLGSMGGEEYISYNNINLAMARLGGRAGMLWNLRMKGRLTKLQNADGSWSGHHCITGRTAVTSAAVLTLVAERSVPRPD